MPSRKLSWPSSIQQDRRQEPKGHRAFNDVFEDEPATDIPDGTLAKAINAWAVGNKARPRNGSTLWTSTRPPMLEGRSGYAAHTEGAYIVPTQWIHMFGMQFPIDVAFLDSGGRVLQICHALHPNRLSPIVWRAEGALELAAGTLKATGAEVGDVIEIR